jgi:ribosomal protein S18 acetylase RimI-like enzyme
MSMLTAMTPTVTLRAVVAADSEFLIAVYASTRAEELAAVPWDDAQKEAFVRMQFVAQDRCWREQKPCAEFCVVLVDERPGGRLYLDRLADEIRIVDIALLPAYRGRGVGTSLLRDVLSEAQAADLPVTIHVERGNRARALYERLGFRPLSTTGVHHLLEARP